MTQTNNDTAATLRSRGSLPPLPTYPVDEQITVEDDILVNLTRLDGHGFAHLRQLMQDQPGASAVLQIGGVAAAHARGSFSGPVLLGTVEPLARYGPVVIADRADGHAASCELWRHTGRCFFGLVDDDRITWHDHLSSVVPATPLEYRLLVRAGLVPGTDTVVAKQLAGHFTGAGLVTPENNIVCIGPMAVKLGPKSPIAPDEIRYCDPDWSVVREFYSPGLSNLELATYTGLRASGLSEEDAYRAAHLINA